MCSRSSLPVLLRPHLPELRFGITEYTTLHSSFGHLWDTPEVEDASRRNAGSIVSVHVSDWREPTRGWCDRVPPGEGIADVERPVRVLADAGCDGFYDLEVFSDDGTFGNRYPDSLMRVPVQELACRGREAFTTTKKGGQV